MQKMENAGGRAGASGNLSRSQLGPPEYAPDRHPVQARPDDLICDIGAVADRVVVATALKAIVFHLGHANLPEADAIRQRMGWDWAGIINTEIGRRAS